jgi:hypothetical protein
LLLIGTAGGEESFPLAGSGVRLETGRAGVGEFLETVAEAEGAAAMPRDVVAGLLDGLVNA